MTGSLLLVWRYVCFNWGKSLVLVLCLLLSALLPVAVSILLRQFSRQIVARADATPAVVGHAGSGLDLALHALYFERGVARPVGWREFELIQESGLAKGIPVNARFSARGFPLVGTSLEYFAFRGLAIGGGRKFVRLGECVIGSQVAEELGLGPGDGLLSDRENVIDIAGLYPLKMRIAGVLARSDTADDRTVFTDLKTVWIIEGLGHGHQELGTGDNDDLLLGREKGHVVASAAVLPYTEVTEANIASFHFHGDQSSFPLTAILLAFPDEKSAAILQGRYPSPDGTVQMVLPRAAIDELLGMVFQTERFFHANSVLIGISTAMLMGLVGLLSVRLRRPELNTLFKIGCSRATVLMLLLGELVFVMAIAGVLLAVSVWLVQFYAGDLVQRLVVGG